MSFQKAVAAYIATEAAYAYAQTGSPRYTPTIEPLTPLPQRHCPQNRKVASQMFSSRISSPETSCPVAPWIGPIALIAVGTSAVVSIGMAIFKK